MIFFNSFHIYCVGYQKKKKEEEEEDTWNIEVKVSS